MQDIINRIFVETASLKKIVGINKFNEKILAPPVQITCRRVSSSEVIKTLGAEDKLSTIKLYTKNYVSVGDEIDDFEVLKVTELKSLYNHEIYAYKVLL